MHLMEKTFFVLNCCLLRRPAKKKPVVRKCCLSTFYQHTCNNLSCFESAASRSFADAWANKRTKGQPSLKVIELCVRSGEAQVITSITSRNTSKECGTRLRHVDVLDSSL